MDKKRALKNGVWLGVWVLFFGTGLDEAVIGFIASIPMEVFWVVEGAVLVWISLEMQFEGDDTRVPNAPFYVFFGSILLAAWLGAQWMLSKPAFVNEIGLGAPLGVVFGIFGWFVSLIVIQGVVMSIRGVDPEERRMERRKRRTDDPYGDKHAAKILNDDS